MFRAINKTNPLHLHDGLRRGLGNVKSIASAQRLRNSRFTFQSRDCNKSADGHRRKCERDLLGLNFDIAGTGGDSSSNYKTRARARARYLALGIEYECNVQ